MPNLILGDTERNLTVSKEFEDDYLSVSVFHSNFGSARTICLNKIQVHELFFHLKSIMNAVDTINNENQRLY